MDRLVFLGNDGVAVEIVWLVGRILARRCHRLKSQLFEAFVSCHTCNSVSALSYSPIHRSDRALILSRHYVHHLIVSTMPFLRPSASLASASSYVRTRAPSSRSIKPAALSAQRTPAILSAQKTLNPAIGKTTTTTTIVRTYASGDYGSGTGDPKGENPLQQGANPSADVEHPGPPPPSAGQGSGSGPTKGTADGHNSGSSPSAPGSGQGRGQGSGNGSVSGKGKTEKGAQPKILRDSLPAEPDEDVKQHNWELSQRPNRAHERLGEEEGGEGEREREKVPKGYWSGEWMGFLCALAACVLRMICIPLWGFIMQRLTCLCSARARWS